MQALLGGGGACHGPGHAVVPYDELDAEVDRWCAELLERSPTALALAKRSFNADTEGIRGISFREKRKPDFRRHFQKKNEG